MSATLPKNKSASHTEKLSLSSETVRPQFNEIEYRRVNLAEHSMILEIMLLKNVCPEIVSRERVLVDTLKALLTECEVTNG